MSMALFVVIFFGDNRTRLYVVLGGILGAFAGGSVGIASGGSASSGFFIFIIIFAFIGLLIKIISTKG